MLLLFSLLGPTFTCHTASVWPLDQDGVGALETMALPASNGERSMRELLATLSAYRGSVQDADALGTTCGHCCVTRTEGAEEGARARTQKAAERERAPLAGGSPELQCVSMECFLKIPAAVLAPPPLSTVVQTSPRMYDRFNKRLRTK